MTDWHRNWQNRFHPDWQEIVHRDENGEKHIADVKTPQGWVLEFQHSQIKPVERQTRDKFYSKLVWVVDGTKQESDRLQFESACKSGELLSPKLSMLRLGRYNGESKMIQEWSGCRAPVFFDFGEEQRIWCLLPDRPDGVPYVISFDRAYFVALHHGWGGQIGQDFDWYMKALSGLVSDYAAFRQKKQSQPIRHNQIPRPRIVNRYSRRF